MKLSASRMITAAILVGVGVMFAAGGIYVGHTDDAPGAALIGFVLLSVTVALAVRSLVGPRPR